MATAALPGILDQCLLLQVDMPGNVPAVKFFKFLLHVTLGSSHCGDMNDLIYDPEGAREG